MQWFVRLFSCGRASSIPIKARNRSRGSDGGLISEPTQIGDYPGDSLVVSNVTGARVFPGTPHVCISVSKSPGVKLGLRLFRSSLQVQSFEPNTPLCKFVNEVPIGSSIYSVNGQLVSLNNIRQILRDCRNETSVALVFSKSPFPATVAGRTASSHRLSHSSTSSVNLSPTPSQWRRTSSEGVGDPPYHEGMTTIDFQQLSKDSMDLGHHSIVTASSSAAEPFNVQVDANALSNRSTPAMVGLENNRILCGEEAETRLGSVPQKIVTSFPHHFGRTANSSHGPFAFETDSIELDSAHLFSLFFRNYLAQVHPGVEVGFVTISVPVDFSPEAVSVLAESASLLQLINKIDVIDHIDAAFTTLIHKNGDLRETATVVADCGFFQTAIGVWLAGMEAPLKTSIPLGVSTMVEIVAELLVHANFLPSIRLADKRFFVRFFKVCEKALKELSMLPTAVVDLGDFEEAFEKHNISVSRKPRILTRDEFEARLKSHPILAQLKAAVLECLAVVPPRVRVKVEVVGGGSRVPFMAQALAEMCGVDKVGRGLDGSSFAAVGAGLWSAGKRVWPSVSRLTPEIVSSLNSDRIAGLAHTQSRLETAHAREETKLQRRNELESFMFEVKHLLAQKSELVDSSVLEPALDECWAWFEDEESGGTSDGTEFAEKLSQLKSVFERAAEKYLQKSKLDRVKTEKSLAANAEYLQGNSAKESASSKREKHAPVQESGGVSLKLASKNRDEGNELFKHGTPADAMNRYLRAVNILAKIRRSDLTADEKALADSIALASNLNMAQCAIKMTTTNDLLPDERNGLLKRGIACADAALVIDPLSSKAKFRKAVCLDRMKETESAKQVIDEALQWNPEDEDLKRLYDSLVASLKEQQSKARKFFSKMFQ